MFLSGTLSDNLSLVDAAVIAVLGYAVVFFGLILLMIVIMALGKAFTANASKATAEPAAPAAPSAAVTTEAPFDPTRDAAPGTAGQLKLYDTPPKTAAMIMAIVADKMGKPLNELRFISIKEVK